MELIYQSTSALVEAIRSRKVSSEEIVQARMSRIEDVNAKLNAAGGAGPPRRVFDMWVTASGPWS